MVRPERVQQQLVPVLELLVLRVLASVSWLALVRVQHRRQKPQALRFQQVRDRRRQVLQQAH